MLPNDTVMIEQEYYKVDETRLQADCMQILRVQYQILNYIYILYYVVIFALAMDGLKTKKEAYHICA